MTEDGLRERIGTALKRLPHWLRAELASPDQHSQAAAEETLAAMLSAAILNGRPAATDQAGADDGAAQTPRAA